MMQIKHIRIKNPNWLHQLAIYKCGRGFELGTTQNKSSKWPEQESNPGQSARLWVQRADQYTRGHTASSVAGNNCLQK